MLDWCVAFIDWVGYWKLMTYIMAAAFFSMVFRAMWLQTKLEQLHKELDRSKSASANLGGDAEASRSK